MLFRSRQRQGFGRDTAKVSSTHSTPSPYLLIHYAWDFLSPVERCSVSKASVYLETYAQMRQKSATTDITAPAWKHINAHFGGNFTEQSAHLIQWQAKIFVFLDKDDKELLETAYPFLHHLYGNVGLSPPARHLRRQRQGFGRDTAKVSSTHSTPSPYLLIHYAWDFLSPGERCSVSKAFVYLETYAHMRQKSATTDITKVRQERSRATPEDRYST